MGLLMFGVRALVRGLSCLRGIGFRGTLRLGLAMYFQTSSLRRATSVLSEFCRVSKTAVWKWIVKLRKRLEVASERKHRRLIAVDETCVKVNGLNYWVFSAVDVERNRIVCMRSVSI